MLFRRLSKSSSSVNSALRSALFSGGGGAASRMRARRRRRLRQRPHVASATDDVSAANRGSPQRAALRRIPFVRRLVKGVHVTAVVRGIAPPVDDDHAKLMIEAAYAAAGHAEIEVQTLVQPTTSGWGSEGGAPAAKSADSGIAATIAGLRSGSKRKGVGGALHVVHFISRFSESDFDATERLTCVGACIVLDVVSCLLPWRASFSLLRLTRVRCFSSPSSLRTAAHAPRPAHAATRWDLKTICAHRPGPRRCLLRNLRCQRVRCAPLLLGLRRACTSSGSTQWRRRKRLRARGARRRRQRRVRRTMRRCARRGVCSSTGAAGKRV